jgi:ABC-2 type transport system permease protein
MRAFWTTAGLTATSALGEGPLFLVDYLLRFARVVVLLSLWRLLFEERPVVAGLTLASVLTYTLIAEAFSDQVAPSIEIDMALWEGSIALRFLRPLGVVAQFAAEMVGRWSLGLLCCTAPLLLVAPLLGVDPRPASPAAGVLFALSLTLGVSIGLALEFLFGTLMVAWSLHPWTLSLVRTAVATLLSGALVPLPLLPWGLGAIFAWLPFASMAAAPLQIYTGIGAPLPLLALQGAWVLLLWPLALWWWRASHERLVIHGG